MRVNVYAEELTDETELVTKQANGTTFYGVRAYMLSPDVLHSTPADDDRSAVTVFVPWTAAGGHDFDLVEGVLKGLLERLDEARAHAGA